MQELKTDYQGVFIRGKSIRIRLYKSKFTISAEPTPQNLLKANNARLQLLSMINDGILTIDDITKKIILSIFNKGYFLPETIPQIKHMPIKTNSETPTFRKIFIEKQREYENRESVFSYESQQLKPGSITTYNAYLSKRFAEFLDIEIGKLKLEDIINFINKHRDRGNSYDYVDNLFIPIREILTDYKEMGVIDNIILQNEYIKKYMKRNLRKSEKLPNLLDDNDIQLIISARKSNIRSLIIFALFTGVRVGEAINIKYENINFKNNTITVTKQFTSGNESTPKSKNSIRKIPIVIIPKNQTPNNPYESVLSNELIYEYNHKLSQNIFIDPDTKLQWKRSDKINEKMRKFFNEIGINKYLTFHDLRYWFTAYSIELVGIHLTSQYLGHKTIEETMRDYTRIKPQNLLSREEAEKLRVFKKVDPKLPQE